MKQRFEFLLPPLLFLLPLVQNISLGYTIWALCENFFATVFSLHDYKHVCNFRLLFLFHLIFLAYKTFYLYLGFLEKPSTERYRALKPHCKVTWEVPEESTDHLSCPTWALESTRLQKKVLEKLFQETHSKHVRSRKRRPLLNVLSSPSTDQVSQCASRQRTNIFRVQLHPHWVGTEG